MSFAGPELSILGPAFVAGLLVLSTHVPLGREVLARGIIFIDLSIAQIAALGVLAAHALGWESGDLSTQATAFGAALCGAFFLHWCESRWPDIQEAIIGTVFVLAASAGILVLSGNPHSGEHLKSILVGQVLWVDYEQLTAVAALYALVLLLWFTVARQGHRLLFYLLFALTVTASVQLVGIYLVFASLIIPALAVRGSGRHALWQAYSLGVAGYGIGLFASAILDLPAGATTVLSLAVFSALGMLAIRVYSSSIPA